MPTEAIIRDTAQTSTPTGKSLATHARKQEMKIAVKQVRLPATVFPPVNGIWTLPNIFPERLARPSPKARAYIPIVAGNDFHIKAQRKIPHTKVTGPRTKRFSSLFLAAASVIVEMTGTWIPLSLMNSETEYKVKSTRRTIMVAG